MRKKRYFVRMAGLFLAVSVLFGSPVTVCAEETPGTAGAEMQEEKTEQSPVLDAEDGTEQKPADMAVPETEETEGPEEAGGTVPQAEEPDDAYPSEPAEAPDTLPVEPMAETGKTGIVYRVHRQSYGWEEDWAANGEQSGTTGQKKRLEAIEIKLMDPEYDGSVLYRVHRQTYGWETDWAENGEQSGTTGQSKRLEAIEIKLTGGMAEHYDIYYRVHAQTFGWLGWAKNGERAGSTAFAKRLEAIEIRLVEKGAQAPGSTAGAYRHPLVKYESHIQSYGWQDAKYDGALSGTAGQKKRLEGIRISLNEQEYSGNILYCTHVQTYGWEQDWAMNGEQSGTTGQKKRLEAIRIKLDGEISQKYDVYYRVHAQTFGWLDWAKNGEAAGTAGLARRLEGIEICLVAKDGKAPGPTGNAFIDETDQIVVIDPGHQAYADAGREPIGPGARTTKAKVSGGTRGVTTGIAEYQVVLDVSLKLKTQLESRGCVVIMVRTSNYVNISNRERAQIANDLDADAFVRLHCNGSQSRSANGAMTICMTRNSPYCPQIYADSRNLSEQVLSHLCRATGARRERLWETDTMSGLNWSKVPVTIVEMGYLTNPTEERRLVSADYQTKLARGIADGISAFLASK